MFDHPSDYVKENSKGKAIEVFTSLKSQVSVVFQTFDYCNFF